jgi:hypothetical protein
MAITRNPVLRLFVVGLSLVLLSRFAFSQDQTPASPAVVTQPPAAQNSSAASGVDAIRGIVKASTFQFPVQQFPSRLTRPHQSQHGPMSMETIRPPFRPMEPTPCVYRWSHLPTALRKWWWMRPIRMCKSILN